MTYIEKNSKTVLNFDFSGTVKAKNVIKLKYNKIRFRNSSISRKISKKINATQPTATQIDLCKSKYPRG